MNKMEKEIKKNADYQKYSRYEEEKNKTKAEEVRLRYEKYKELIDEEDWAID